MLLGSLLRRSFELFVTLLAVYAFFSIRVGRRTPYGHLAAIFSTEPAHEAAADFQKAGQELTGKILDDGKALAHLKDAGRGGHN